MVRLERLRSQTIDPSLNEWASHVIAQRQAPVYSIACPNSVMQIDIEHAMSGLGVRERTD